MNELELITYNARKAFGDSVVVTNKQFQEGLPAIYAFNYNFYSVRGDFRFILIIQKTNVINLDVIGSIKRFLERNGYDQLLYFTRTPTSFLKGMLKQMAISYLSVDGDVFIADENNKEMVNQEEDKYTKATQLVINYYLEVSDIGSTREIADYIGISSSSVNRAQIFLNNLGVLDRVGQSIVSYKLASKKELLEKTEPYWIRPYRRRIELLMRESDFNSFKKDTYLSGDDALEQYTTLESSGPYLEIAIKKDLLMKVIDRYAKNYSSYDDGVSVYSFEEFIYDPGIFAKDGMISRFDLYIIVTQRYKGTDDPRIKKAINELRNELIK